MAVSVLSPFCFQDNLGNLENCLRRLREQTSPPAQIIVADDSPEEVKPSVEGLCKGHGAVHLPLPFVDYKPQWAAKYNRAFPLVTGDMVLILCSNWILEKRWLEEMVKTLTALGPKSMVAGDSARKVLLGGDWFAGSPDLFQITNPHLVDEGFMNLMWAADWLPWDEEFDRVGAWHAVVEWGHRLMQNEVKVWIRRDLHAEHQERHPRPEWLSQTQASEGILRGKGVVV